MKTEKTTVTIYRNKAISKRVGSNLRQRAVLLALMTEYFSIFLFFYFSIFFFFFFTCTLGRNFMSRGTVAARNTPRNDP